jgi:hypothetical protein
MHPRAAIAVAVSAWWAGVGQVTACESLSCGPGVCRVLSTGAACDCAGTGRTGAACAEPVVSGGDGDDSSSGAGSTSGEQAPGVASSDVDPTPSPTPSPAQVAQCPGGAGVDGAGAPVECSGHGTCTRSSYGCSASDVTCIAACRCALVCEAGPPGCGIRAPLSCTAPCRRCPNHPLWQRLPLCGARSHPRLVGPASAVRVAPLRLSHSHTIALACAGPALLVACPGA